MINALVLLLSTIAPSVVCESDSVHRDWSKKYTRMMTTPGRSVRVDAVRRTKRKPSTARPKNKTAISFAGEPLLFRDPPEHKGGQDWTISRQRNPSSHGVFSRGSAGRLIRGDRCAPQSGGPQQ